MLWRLTLLLVLTLNSCSRQDSIDDFVGRWESPPLMEMAMEEVVPAIRAGTMPEFEKMREEDPEEFEELLKKSDAELKEEFAGGMVSRMFDLRFALTITSDSKLIYSVIVNGEEALAEVEEVEYEVSKGEILVRGEEETRVIYIEKDHIRVRNEERDKFPTFIRYYRAKTELREEGE